MMNSIYVLNTRFNSEQRDEDRARRRVSKYKFDEIDLSCLCINIQ
jgi:hypothetical protein